MSVERPGSRASSRGPYPPPAPLPTYLWEELRRSRNRGGYPWTILDKEPLPEYLDVELLLRTEATGLRLDLEQLERCLYYCGDKRVRQYRLRRNQPDRFQRARSEPTPSLPSCSSLSIMEQDQAMADLPVDEDTGEEFPFGDEEIPDFVMEYLQSEEGQTGENIPDHILEYIQSRAAALERSRQQQVPEEIYYTKDEVRILDDACRRLEEQGEKYELPPLAVQELEEPAVHDEFDQFFQRAANLEIPEPVAAVNEFQMNVTCANKKQPLAAEGKRKSSFKKGKNDEIAAPEPAPEETSPVDRQFKLNPKFDLRSISMPPLPNVSNLKMPKFVQETVGKIGDRFKSPSGAGENAEEEEEQGAKPKRRDFSTSPLRQKIRDELEQQKEAWNSRRVVEKKFSLSDFKIRGRNRAKEVQEEDGKVKATKRTDSISPIRRKIREELEAWNTRGVVETKFNLSDFKIRGRKRDKAAKSAEEKRPESVSPMRQKIRKEIEAWNTREVVETKFNLSDFKIRGRKRDKEKSAEVKRTESISPMRQKIREEIEGWNKRQVVETKFSLKDFRIRGRKGDKDGQVKGFVALLPGVFPSRSKSREPENQYEEVHPPPTLEVPPTPVLMVTAPEGLGAYDSAEGRGEDVPVSSPDSCNCNSNEQETMDDVENLPESEVADQSPQDVEVVHVEKIEALIQNAEPSSSEPVYNNITEQSVKTEVYGQDMSDVALTESEPEAKPLPEPVLELAPLPLPVLPPESVDLPEDCRQSAAAEMTPDQVPEFTPLPLPQLPPEPVQIVIEQPSPTKEHVPIVDREVIDVLVQESEALDQLAAEAAPEGECQCEEVEETEAVTKPVTLADRGRMALQATKSKIQTTLSKDNLQATRKKLQTTGTRLQSTLSTKTQATRQKLQSLKTNKNLQAAGQKIQSTLSKQNLQATGQKIQTKISGTLGKRKKGKGVDGSPPADDAEEAGTAFRADAAFGESDDYETSTPKDMLIPKRIHKKKYQDVKGETTPKLSYPTAKRRTKRPIKISPHLAANRLVYDENLQDVEEVDDESRIESEATEEPSISQSTGAIPQERPESDKENEVVVRPKRHRFSNHRQGFHEDFARPQSAHFESDTGSSWVDLPEKYSSISQDLADAFSIPANSLEAITGTGLSRPERPSRSRSHKGIDMLADKAVFHEYENTVPRRKKRLSKSPVTRPDWNQTWPRKDLPGDKPAAPKRAKPHKPHATNQYPTWPRRSPKSSPPPLVPKRARSKTQIDDAAMGPFDEHVVTVESVQTTEAEPIDPMETEDVKLNIPVEMPAVVEPVAESQEVKIINAEVTAEVSEDGGPIVPQRRKISTDLSEPPIPIRVKRSSIRVSECDGLEVEKSMEGIAEPASTPSEVQTHQDVVPNEQVMQGLDQLLEILATRQSELRPAADDGTHEKVDNDEELDESGYTEIKHSKSQSKTPPPRPPPPVYSPPSTGSEQSSYSYIYTVPRRKAKYHTIASSPERPPRTYCTIRPHRPPRKTRTPDDPSHLAPEDTEAARQHSSSSSDEQTKIDLHSLPVVERMRTRPLPAPPRTKRRNSHQPPPKESAAPPEEVPVPIPVAAVVPATEEPATLAVPAVEEDPIVLVVPAIEEPVDPMTEMAPIPIQSGDGYEPIETKIEVEEVSIGIQTDPVAEDEEGITAVEVHISAVEEEPESNEINNNYVGQSAPETEAEESRDEMSGVVEGKLILGPVEVLAIASQPEQHPAECPVEHAISSLEKETACPVEEIVCPPVEVVSIPSAEVVSPPVEVPAPAEVVSVQQEVVSSPVEVTTPEMTPAGTVCSLPEIVSPSVDAVPPTAEVVLPPVEVVVQEPVISTSVEIVQPSTEVLSVKMESAAPAPVEIAAAVIESPVQIAPSRPEVVTPPVETLCPAAQVVPTAAAASSPAPEAVPAPVESARPTPEVTAPPSQTPPAEAPTPESAPDVECPPVPPPRQDQSKKAEPKTKEEETRKAPKPIIDDDDELDSYSRIPPNFPLPPMRLQLSALDVDRISVREVQADRLVVSAFDTNTLQVSQLTCTSNAGQPVVINLPPGSILTPEAPNSQEDPPPVPPIPRKRRDASHKLANKAAAPVASSGLEEETPAAEEAHRAPSVTSTEASQTPRDEADGYPLVKVEPPNPRREEPTAAGDPSFSDLALQLAVVSGRQLARGATVVGEGAYDVAKRVAQFGWDRVNAQLERRGIRLTEDEAENVKAIVLLLLMVVAAIFLLGMGRQQLSYHWEFQYL